MRANSVFTIGKRQRGPVTSAGRAEYSPQGNKTRSHNPASSGFFFFLIYFYFFFQLFLSSTYDFSTVFLCILILFTYSQRVAVWNLSNKAMSLPFPPAESAMRGPREALSSLPSRRDVNYNGQERLPILSNSRLMKTNANTEFTCQTSSAENLYFGLSCTGALLTRPSVNLKGSICPTPKALTLTCCIGKYRQMNFKFDGKINLFSGLFTNGAGWRIEARKMLVSFSAVNTINAFLDNIFICLSITIAFYLPSVRRAIKNINCVKLAQRRRQRRKNIFHPGSRIGAVEKKIDYSRTPIDRHARDRRVLGWSKTRLIRTSQ